VDSFHVWIACGLRPKVRQTRCARDGITAGPGVSIEGVDAAVEALGSPVTWEAALRVTKPGGRVSNVGYHGEVPEPLPVPLAPFGYGMADKKISGGLNRGGRERLRRIFRLMETGRFDPTPMTTHEFPFDAIETAFWMMANKADGIIKPLIRFGLH
jgi:threonine dehydrogenase-like Zn-dependent dehydrogenase